MTLCPQPWPMPGSASYSARMAIAGAGESALPALPEAPVLFALPALSALPVLFALPAAPVNSARRAVSIP